MAKMNKGLATQILEDEYGIDVDELLDQSTSNGKSLNDLIALLKIVLDD
jgi:hypothetical protein